MPRARLAAAALVLLLAAAGSLAHPGYALRVDLAAGPGLLPVAPGDCLAVGFLHSMYKVPQYEVYQIGPAGELLLAETVFGSAAALEYYLGQGQAGAAADPLWRLPATGALAVPELRYLGTGADRFTLYLGQAAYRLATGSAVPAVVRVTANPRLRWPGRRGSRGWVAPGGPCRLPLSPLPPLADS